MVRAFLFFAAAMWRDNYLRSADWHWLRQIRDEIDDREESLPEVGRYNGGQKLLFFARRCA